MDNVSPQGFQQGNFRPSESLATAPPPPSEVKIRTMRTDLESMSKSGGGLPRFQNIKVGTAGGASSERVSPVFVAPTPVVASQPSPAQSQPQMGGKSKTNIFGIVATIIILLALAIGGWFAYAKFFSDQAAAPISPIASTAATAPSSTVSTPSNSASVPVLILPSTASSKASGTANWISFGFSPGPNSTFTMQYPSDWEASELSFRCPAQSGALGTLGAISPTRTDLPGYSGISVAYLVQFCVSGGSSSIGYSGFMKAPLSSQPTDGDKISLNNGTLEATQEYSIAQQIIARATTTFSP